MAKARSVVQLGRRIEVAKWDNPKAGAEHRLSPPFAALRAGGLV